MKSWPIPAMGFTAAILDPPWEFHEYTPVPLEGRGACTHYPVMSTEKIIELLNKDLNFEWIFAPDSLVVMWTTWPMLAIGAAHKVMKGIGFRCTTGGAWFKTAKNGQAALGMGYMFRDSCEPFLVGVRGAPGLPRGKRNWRNGFQSLRREHSRKPDYLHRALEAMYPGGTYLEVFARESRPGWFSYGNEVDAGFEERAAKRKSVRQDRKEASPPESTLFDLMEEKT